MPSKIFSASTFGFECRIVEVEVDILNGPASITIVGLGDASVQESKERIRSAIKNSGADYPRRKKTINLAPADIPKHGPMFDLPIALGILKQSDQIPAQSLDKTIAVGELALSGELRRTPGILPIVAHAAEKGFSAAIVPYANAEEAALVSNITIIPAHNLFELIDHLRGDQIIPAFSASLSSFTEEEMPWCFEDIRGHEYVKRALTIAAAGGHNVLLYGPPGSGKTLLARSFQSILPRLTFQQAVEVTKIYSIAGKLQPEQSLIHTPPFRAIHHTASTISLVGGGAVPRPGEVSLAHHGVLFLDELLEFSRSTLDCLRQPIEDGTVHVTRAKGSAMFPTNFILVAATNPCPCGFLGETAKACRCTPSQLQQYRKKLSGALLDRIDIECYVPRLPFEKISGHESHETSEEVLKKIVKARQLQYERYSGSENSMVAINGKISSATVRRFCFVKGESLRLLQDAFRKFHYSGRSYYRILKVARTIADLENAREIEPHHLAEALQYRPQFENKS